MKECFILEMQLTFFKKKLNGCLGDQLGTLTFRVQLQGGSIWKRHATHIHMNMPTEPIVNKSSGISTQVMLPNIFNTQLKLILNLLTKR